MMTSERASGEVGARERLLLMIFNGCNAIQPKAWPAIAAFYENVDNDFELVRTPKEKATRRSVFSSLEQL